jgi:hypothetical protein
VANKRAGSAVIKALVNHDKTDVNALWTSLDERITGNVTALHLAVLHNNLDAAKFLLAKKETNGEIKCKLFIEASGFRSSKDSEPKLSGRNWTALELAIIMGHVHMVALLLKVCDTDYVTNISKIFFCGLKFEIIAYLLEFVLIMKYWIWSTQKICK